MNREEAVTAWQRDRQRLRRVLGMAKSWRVRFRNKASGAESWYRMWLESYGWSAAWKAAAKREREWHQLYYANTLKFAAERDNLRSALKGEIESNNRRAEKIVELEGDCDEWQAKFESMLEQASKNADYTDVWKGRYAGMVAERDELRGRLEEALGVLRDKEEEQ